MTDRITLLPTTKDELQGSLDAFVKLVPYMVNIAPEIAMLRKSFYDAYVEAGFTPGEALELCKSMEI